MTTTHTIGRVAKRLTIAAGVWTVGVGAYIAWAIARDRDPFARAFDVERALAGGDGRG